MKKILSLLTAIVLFVGIFTFASCGKKDSGDISGISSAGDVINRAVPDFSVRENGDFVVLQFTDTHLLSGSTDKDIKTLDNMKAQATSLNPDLVVITGDMVEGNNSKKNYNKKAALEAVGKMFEDLNMYWAYVPGNNDGEMDGTSSDVAEFLTRYSHCIVSNEAGLTGATQYCVDVKNSDGKTVHSLVFMDSLGRDENNDYDYMKDDQVQWLKSTLNEKNSDSIKCSVFFHMNTPCFTYAATDGVPYSESYAAIPVTLKNSINKNSAVDDAIESSGCVGLVAIGHIHPEENWCSFYNGRYYHVASPSGYRAVSNPSCTLITIHTPASDFKSMYDFAQILF